LFPASVPKGAAREAGRAQREAALCFLAVLLITVLYQAVYCRATTGGDLAGLFFSGTTFHRPPELAGYVYKGDGYDGQMYRLVAHDPLAQKGYWKFLDDPRYRARRALVPLAAALGGGGSPWLVDLSYIAITDILLALGGVCFVRLARDSCPPAGAAALYILIPAVVAATDRMVLDGPLVAGFLAAWLFYRERRTGALMGVLALVPLLREVGVAVTAGVALAYLAARNYRRAAGALATVLPALLWWWFVALRTPSSPAAGDLLTTPLVPQMRRLFTVLPNQEPFPLDLIVQALEFLGCFCLLLSLAWCAKAVVDGIRRRRIDDDVLLVLPLAVVAAFAGSPAIMEPTYAFLRVDSPVLAWVALRMLRLRFSYAGAYVMASSAPLLIYRARPLYRFLFG
jgi:hypothetical protein